MQRYNPLFDIVGQVDRTPLARRVAARVLRELRVGRESAGRALVLGPRKERRNLRRAWRALLRHVCRLARSRAKSSRRRRVAARGRRSRTRCSARCATATTCMSTSITASISRAGWIARSCGWFSNTATCCCTAGCRRTRGCTRSPMKRRHASCASCFPARASMY